jgi:hypothetical protein
MTRKVAYLLPFALYACAAQPQPEPRLTPASSHNLDMPWSTRVRIAKSASIHCDREQRCANIGPDRAYPTRAVCVNAWTLIVRERLTSSCRDGMDAEMLHGCLASLRRAPCGFGETDMDAVVQCQPDALCKGP